MRFFIKTRKFKRLVAILAIVVAAVVVISFIGGAMVPGSSIGGAIAAPFQKLITNMSNSISDTAAAFNDNWAIMEENAALKEKIASLENQLVEYDEAIAENDFYKDFLDIKENNPDFRFAEASVIASDSTDVFRSFTIDKGSLHGVAAYDPVISSAGVIGYVTEVALATSKVATILDPSLNVGGYDSRTGDAGIITGETEYAKNGCTRLYNLPKTSSITIGDYITTSGGGIFPRGLILGTIEDIARDSEDNAVSAWIRPNTDFDSLRNVMVVTYFEGQGSVASESVAR